MKLLVPLIIVLPGLIAFYYFGNDYLDTPDLVYPLLVKKVLPASLTGLFAAVILGAVLSTFNSVLNSASTIFCLDLLKPFRKGELNDTSMVVYGKWVAVILAIVSILAAPMVANAPEGLYQLLQQLNGIFFIPIASILFAGFFTKRINANGAKAGLVFGLIFYLLTTFVFQIQIHFVHIWGIEFVLNFILMFFVSALRPTGKIALEPTMDDSKPWPAVGVWGLLLCAITLLIYVFLS